MNQQPYLLALHRRLKLTRPRFEKLHAFFKGDWQKAYQASFKDWTAAQIDKPGLEKFFSHSETISPSQEYDLLQDSGAKLVTCLQEPYPDLWHHIAQAPALFFYKGSGENLNQKSVAVVGARKMTNYGERALASLLRPVFEKKITVVSGLAYGTDAAAHKLALKCQAPTIAVLGNGIDSVYPKQNSSLAAQILEAGGTLVSEYLPHTQARPEYFPERNRLVAGLAQATVVLEGALKSGSLITARAANDFGRSVWAVPGDVFQANSAGCNELIFQGEATPLTQAQYLLENLKLDNAITLHEINLSDEEKELVKKLRRQSEWWIDDFLAESKQAMPEIMASLVQLELKGVLKFTDNKVFALI